MFVIKQSDTYTWPVEVKIPADGGRFDKQTFDAVFKRLPQTRLVEIRKQYEIDNLVSDVEIAREVLVGWVGITDADKQDIPFSEKMCEELLNIPRVAFAIVTAFTESISGAKRKN